MTDPDNGHGSPNSNPARDLQSNEEPDTTASPFPFYHPAPTLASSRYNRQLLIPQISLTGQQRLSRAKVLVVGLGGLGSPAALYLAGAGVHTLGLLDHDVVEESNLHRQIAHRESSVHAHTSKVQSALRSCRELNSEINYVTHEVRIGGGGGGRQAGNDVLQIIAGYDVVLDCTDNPATRYLVSDCCAVLGKTLVSGAAQKLEGQLLVLNWPIYSADDNKLCGRGPCYRCVFPHPPSPDMVRSCSEIGILGPVVGTVGTLMASETIRVIVRDHKEDRKPTMLLYSAWPADPRSMFRVIGLRGRRKDCVVCGEDVTLKEKGLARITAESIRKGRMDYESWCGKVEDVRILREDERISPTEFLNQIGSSPVEQAPLIIDTREEYEIELGPKIDGSVNIPMSKILRSDGAVVSGVSPVNEIDTVVRHQDNRPVCFICQQGNDSQIAAKKLKDRLAAHQLNGEQTSMSASTAQRWIGDVEGGFTALNRVVRPD